MRLKIRLFTIVYACIIIVFEFPFSISAQVPPNSFYHDRETVLPYARLTATFPDGSRHTIPFTPILVGGSPVGLNDFTRDIDIRGRLVFAGNGIVSPGSDYNSYGDHNLAGQIPLVLYNYPTDFQSRYGEVSDLHIRVHEAQIRGAVAVIIFGIPDNPGWHEPFISLPKTIPPVSLPVISISFNEARLLLREAGIELDNSGRELQKVLSLSPVELPVISNLFIKGNFGSVQSKNFTVNYLPDILNDQMMKQHVEDEERSLDFVKTQLHLTSFELPARTTLYFPDFTSLRFYTGISKHEYDEHVGRNRVFSFYQMFDHPIQNEYFHIVKNITLLATRLAWGESNPVILNGIGCMTAHFATGDPDADIDAIIAERLKENQLVPVAHLFELDEEQGITASDVLQLETGSLLKFLFSSYSIENFRQLYTEFHRANTPKDRLLVFDELYLKDFKALQREWIEMLAFGYDIPGSAVDDYLLQCESIIENILRSM